MGNLKYIFKRIKSMDKKAMFNKIDSIHKKTNKSKFSILIDMQKCAIKYGAGYMDYDLFEMYNLKSKQRDTYITRGRNNSLIAKYNNKDYFHLFENKDEFNTLFKDYIKRDWINVKGTDKQKLIEWMRKHQVFMAKPIDGGCGKGIEKIKVSDYSSLDDLYDYLVNNEVNFELEELIKQHPDVSNIYPDAINTVRIVSILKNETPNIICAYFRIGNGKFVDNFNSGGMVAPVNKDTGEVIDMAIDKNKNLYVNHPQTNSQIKGFKFPYWNEAIEMVKNASKVVPQMAYIGWDVAFTPTGPLFVEGNEYPGHDIYQLPEHTPNKLGIMPNFNNI